MEDVNPSTSKRPRRDDAWIGKCVAEQMHKYARPHLTKLKDKLLSHAVTLMKAARSSTHAADSLLAAKGENRVVESLQLRFTDAAKEHMEALPENLKASVKQIEQAFQELAIHKRRREATVAEAELKSLMDDAFAIEAAALLRVEKLSNPLAALALQELIQTEQETFKVALELQMLELEEKETRKKEAAEKRAQAKEARRMEIEQLETSATVKLFVEQEFRKQGPRLIAALIDGKGKASASKKVHFHANRKESRNKSGSKSRGRSTSRASSRSKSSGRSASRSASRGRSKTPHPRGRFGSSKSRSGSRKSGGRSQERRSRSHTSHSRSHSENGRGDRGARPRRPPSGKQGRSARVGGGGGSKMGPRR